MKRSNSEIINEELDKKVSDEKLLPLSTPLPNGYWNICGIIMNKSQKALFDKVLMEEGIKKLDQCLEKENIGSASDTK